MVVPRGPVRARGVGAELAAVAPVAVEVHESGQQGQPGLPAVGLGHVDPVGGQRAALTGIGDGAVGDGHGTVADDTVGQHDRAGEQACGRCGSSQRSREDDGP